MFQGNIWATSESWWSAELLSCSGDSGTGRKMRAHASCCEHPRIHRAALLLVALASVLPVSPSEQAGAPGPRVDISSPRDGHVFWSPPTVRARI